MDVKRRGIAENGTAKEWQRLETNLHAAQRNGIAVTGKAVERRDKEMQGNGRATTVLDMHCEGTDVNGGVSGAAEVNGGAEQRNVNAQISKESEWKRIECHRHGVAKISNAWC